MSQSLQKALKLELSGFISQGLLIYGARQVTNGTLELLMCLLKYI